MSQCPKCGAVFQGRSLGAHAWICDLTNEDLFWNLVEKSEDCWRWKGALHRDGYGRFNFDFGGKKRMRIAHRVAWELTNGPVPEGLDVLHHCDQRDCCNPAHLFVGTHRDNMKDMVAKGRKSTKLTADDVRYIRSSGEESSALASKFGVTYITIWAVRTWRKWKHVQP